LYHFESMNVALPTVARLLFMAALAALGFHLLRRPPTVAAEPRPPRQERWALLGVVALALILRSALIPTLPPGIYELENVPFDRVLGLLTGQLGPGPPGIPIYYNFHTPLLPSLLDGWFVLGDAIGMGGDIIIWLRLPNLLLAAALILLLVRIGHSLGTPVAGWAAAAVFAVSPTFAPLSVYQGHYFLEMVTVTWFWERLACFALARRPVHRSLAAAAAIALWSGYMAMVVVLPGMILYLVLATHRNMRRQGLAAVLVVAALYGPIATAALETASDFLMISVSESLEPAAAEGLSAIHGHTPMSIEAPNMTGFLWFPMETGGVVFGETIAALALAAFALALAIRPTVAWFPALLLVFYALISTRLATRWVNYTSLFPLLLVMPLWGAAIAANKLRNPWWRNGAVALLAAAMTLGPALSPPQSDRLPQAADLVSWLGRGERLSHVAAPLQEELHRELPVLILAVEKDVFYHLCPDRITLEGYLTCKDEYYYLPRGDSLSRGTLMGRPVAFTQMDDINPEDDLSCPRLDFLSQDEAWRDTPFLALITPEFRRYEADGICADLFPRADCVLVTNALGILIYRCHH